VSAEEPEKDAQRMATALMTFNDQLERILEAAVVVLLGAVQTTELLSPELNKSALRRIGPQQAVLLRFLMWASSRADSSDDFVAVGFAFLRSSRFAQCGRDAVDGVARVAVDPGAAPLHQGAMALGPRPSARPHRCARPRNGPAMARTDVYVSPRTVR
jgi:hypothetical protein